VGASGREAVCIWLTGRPGAGKSTIGRALAHDLAGTGTRVVLVDDDTRRHLVEGSAAIAWLVRTLTGCGVTVVVAADLPSRDEREHVRAATGRFAEVFVDGGSTDSEQGGGYEEPFAPELRVPTHDRDPAASIALLTSWLEHSGVLG
jgi:adenylylsulfate kinase-like enzyme